MKEESEVPGESFKMNYGTFYDAMARPDVLVTAVGRYARSARPGRARHLAGAPRPLPRPGGGLTHAHGIGHMPARKSHQGGPRTRGVGLGGHPSSETHRPKRISLTSNVTVPARYPTHAPRITTKALVDELCGRWKGRGPRRKTNDPDLKDVLPARER